MEIITRIPQGFGPKENFKRGDIIHVPIIEPLSINDWSDGEVPAYAPLRDKVYLYMPSKPVVVIII